MDCSGFRIVLPGCTLKNTLAPLNEVGPFFQVGLFRIANLIAPNIRRIRSYECQILTMACHLKISVFFSRLLSLCPTIKSFNLSDSETSFSVKYPGSIVFVSSNHVKMPYYAFFW